MDTLEAVNEDSFTIRLPKSEEERIASRCVDRLGTVLDTQYTEKR